MTISFDARPLTDPIDPQKVTAHARENKMSSAGVGAITSVFAWVIGGVMLLVAASISISFITFFLGQGKPIPALLVALATIVIGGVVVMMIVRSRAAGRILNYRLSHFAAANHMQYLPTVPNPPLPGMIFNHGDSRMANQVVRGTHPRFVEFGNYHYTTGDDKDRKVHTWGYVAIKLDVPLPNIVLDSTGNNSLFGSNLPSNFNKNQRLGLEGDFDKHFALYCPSGYERDALYLFTPDIMARFIDNAAQLDVEIIDDWLFFYTSRQASTLDAATWAWLFGAVDAVNTKFDQWARWRDDRLPAAEPANPVPTNAAPAAASSHALPFAAPTGMITPPTGVAHEGRRLKKGVPWVMFIVIGAFVLVGVIAFLS